MKIKLGIAKKKQLEMILQQIPSHKFPKVHLEQYTTPADIAADILWNAHSLGDIEGKKVVDLGCGTGVFTVGSALMGARRAIGVDVDADALEIAKMQASRIGVDGTTKFICEDVQSFTQNADTVIQNPPFGAQKAGMKNADRIFMEKAMETAPVVYSFHIRETEKFVEQFFSSLHGRITHRFHYGFTIPRVYHFHQKEKINVDVMALRVENQA